MLWYKSEISTIIEVQSGRPVPPSAGTGNLAIYLQQEIATRENGAAPATCAPAAWCRKAVPALPTRDFLDLRICQMSSELPRPSMFLF
eukprot:3733571-Rhodomonas_salina.1